MPLTVQPTAAACLSVCLLTQLMGGLHFMKYIDLFCLLWTVVLVASFSDTFSDTTEATMVWLQAGEI